MYLLIIQRHYVYALSTSPYPIVYTIWIYVEVTTLQNGVEHRVDRVLGFFSNRPNWEPPSPPPPAGERGWGGGGSHFGRGDRLCRYSRYIYMYFVGWRKGGGSCRSVVGHSMCLNSYTYICRRFLYHSLLFEAFFFNFDQPKKQKHMGGGVSLYISWPDILMYPICTSNCMQV